MNELVEFDLSNPNYQEKVKKLFEENHNILTIRVVDPSLLNDTYIPDSTDSEIATYSSVTYKAVGPCKEAGEYTGSSAIAVAIGEPGMEVTIDKKVSVANMKESSYNVSDKSISAVVGFSVTKIISNKGFVTKQSNVGKGFAGKVYGYSYTRNFIY